MVNTVKVTTDNRISVVQLPDWSLDEQEKLIGADCTESVKTRRIYDLFRDTYVMIVDESGHNKKLPINPLGSYLYGTDHHGMPIVGDIIFGILKDTDITPLDDAEAENVMKFLMMHFPFLTLAEDGQ